MLDILKHLRASNADQTSEVDQTSNAGQISRDDQTSYVSQAAGAETTRPFGPKELSQLLARYNRIAGEATRRYAKKALLPYYLRVKAEEPQRWATWHVDAATEERLFALLRMKPRRTASGVATITVITKPWPCSGACIYCPNDIRMPKSYLADEPACQRAERAYFDPYLQVYSRLHTLNQMGHPTDKVEIIVLGGTWTDYPQSYRTWFATQLFEALNDGDTNTARGKAAIRQQLYENAGIPSSREEAQERCRPWQEAIAAGDVTYNDAWSQLYGEGTPWETVATFQTADSKALKNAQAKNESADNRMVGLVVETRPDAITPQTAAELRNYGCTKVQIGIQSLDPHLLEINRRAMTPEAVEQAVAILRLFGFKIHIHFMANLYGATAEKDRADYHRLVTDPAYLPDEVKLYPCVLVAGTPLEHLYDTGKWAPYDEPALIALLRDNALATPPYTRISRMIRDISAHDIKAGNKKTNLRQMVESTADAETTLASPRFREIRSREIAGETVSEESLALNDVTYSTTVTEEHFLQWVTPDDRIAGFLRLSLPKAGSLTDVLGMSGMSELPAISEMSNKANKADLPNRSDRSDLSDLSGLSDQSGQSDRSGLFALQEGAAMIREVHIYGRTARIHSKDDGVQHRGLGRQLIARAAEIAREAGYDALNVISAVGTRAYYRNLGFEDCGLYQRLSLI